MTPLHDQESDAAPWAGSFSPVATADDILACFRLLLGRLPHREEWRGHAMRVGEPLETVVGSYVNSLEFSRRGLGDPGALGLVELARLPAFSIYTETDDAAVGRFVRSDNYEADVTAVFRRFVQPGWHVLDLGANIGYFTMLSAALVGPSGSVMAIEPNPNNARLIEASRRVNGFSQVRVVQVAAGREAGLLVLHRAHSNGTTSAAPDDTAGLIASETVACVRVDGIVPRGRRIGLIKADVEGAEYLAFERLPAHHPAGPSRHRHRVQPVDDAGHFRHQRSCLPVLADRTWLPAVDRAAGWQPAWRGPGSHHARARGTRHRSS